MGQKSGKEDTMRVFVAGASGALGSRLVPQLIDAGHEVIGTHNSPASAELLRTLGAKPVVLDLLDARAVRKAVLEAEPEAIVHQATALANAKWGRSFDKAFARTNELRTKGTDALLAAAPEAGLRRSSRRASPPTGTRARAGRSRPRTIRSIPPRRRTRSSPSPRWPISRRWSPSSVRSCSATASSTAPPTTA
jgi:NAD(P)-dependent dehydrogenase (short-subunit alcohol dehydrogenase family)